VEGDDAHMIPHPPAILQEWALFITILISATIAVSGAVGLIYRYTLRPRIEALTKALAAVQYHLEPNGHEAEGDPADEGLPLRTIAMRNGRRMLDIDKRLAVTCDWIKQHKVDHTGEA